MFLSVYEFHENWQRKSHTFLMGTSDITFKHPSTFWTPASRPCHSTPIHYLAKVFWHFVGTAMTVTEVISINYYRMLYKNITLLSLPPPEVINLGIPWVRTKNSEHVIREKQYIQKSCIEVSPYTYPTNCLSTAHPSVHSLACVSIDLCISNTLLTQSIVQSPSWEANQLSAS